MAAGAAATGFDALRVLGRRPWTCGGSSSSTTSDVGWWRRLLDLLPAEIHRRLLLAARGRGPRFAGRGWCGCGSAVHRFLLRRRWSADGGMGACSSASGLKVVVLGFFFCEDEDLPDVDHFHLARVLSSGRLRRRMEQRIFCLEFAGSGGIRSLAPMLLFRPSGSGGSGVKLFFCVDIK